jgi:hydroxymethylpyrimidine/phosphomethylpyrimidine kinase
MRPTVLIVAGSDSSGGAGIVRDSQVLTELGTDVRCVITAVTAQTNARVTSIHYLPPESVRQQMQTALEAGGIGAIKIGMLGQRAAVEAVAAALPSRDEIPIVLDPVLTSSSGRSLMEPPGLVALRELLIPRVTLLTPNLAEAQRVLLEEAASNEASMVAQAKRLLCLGPQAVLLKGGHAIGSESVDVLVGDACEPVCMRASRVRVELRGTGCALSSAIAASLALEMSMPAACEVAKAYVLGKLRRAAGIG